MATRWTRTRIREKLIEAHNKWASNFKSDTLFDYSFLRKHFSALASAIDNRNNFINLADAFENAGIDPDCHYGQYRYQNKEKTFKAVLNEIKENCGLEKLNDNSMNDPDSIELPEALRIGCLDNYPVCKKSKCKKNDYSLQRIYATGRRYYGDWKSAVESIGLSYENDVLRKVAAREWITYIEMYANFIKSKGFNYNISDLKDRKRIILFTVD